jgi:hypothetical protein
MVCQFVFLFVGGQERNQSQGFWYDRSTRPAERASILHVLCVELIVGEGSKAKVEWMKKILVAKIISSEDFKFLMKNMLPFKSYGHLKICLRI